MTIDGMTVHFLLEREWKNYQYTWVSQCKAESILHKAKVVDAICLEERTVLRLETIVLGEHGTDWLMRIEPEYDDDRKVEVVEYSIANVLSDRLPNHDFKYVDDE